VLDFSSFKLLYKNFFGLNFFILKTILIRFEFFLNFKLTLLNKEYILAVNNFCVKNFYSICNLNKKIIFNLFFYFLLSNFKYNRHILGLPVNGQRT
jgi:ribosomal protein S13